MRTALRCPCRHSASEQYEPDAIGYAASPDGNAWTKRQDNPIFKKI